MQCRVSDWTRMHMQLAESLPVCVATGMFVVCGMAYKSGDINRLVYGVDTQGMTCGSRSVYLGTTFDLTSRKNLYYLNPLDLLSLDGIAFAKTVCVDSCPGAATCPLGVFPCTDSAAFRCAALRCHAGQQQKAGCGETMLTCEKCYALQPPLLHLCTRQLVRPAPRRCKHGHSLLWKPAPAVVNQRRWRCGIHQRMVSDAWMGPMVTHGDKARHVQCTYPCCTVRLPLLLLPFCCSTSLG